MKVQFRSILFALVVPVAACGGDREAPKPDHDSTTTSTLVPQPRRNDAGVAVPVSVAPAVVERPLPTKFDELVALGRELARKGELDNAVTMFEAAIKLDRNRAEPHIETARIYIAMNKKGLAIASANKAVKRAPLSSVAWNTKGRAELSAHDYDQAIEAFSKAAELDQDNAFAWNNLGYTELLLEKYEDAAEHLLEATRRKGSTGYMFNNLGTALEHLDRLDEARAAYEAGGKLGSQEAVASRSRLEGVKTIVVKLDAPTNATTSPEPKEYELTDEGEISDEAPPDN